MYLYIDNKKNYRYSSYSYLLITLNMGNNNIKLNKYTQLWLEMFKCTKFYS